MPNNAQTHYVSSFSDETLDEKMNQNYVKVGDIIENLTDNQEDYTRYRVILRNNKKYLVSV